MAYLDIVKQPKKYLTNLKETPETRTNSKQHLHLLELDGVTTSSLYFLQFSSDGLDVKLVSCILREDIHEAYLGLPANKGVKKHILSHFGSSSKGIQLSVAALPDSANRQIPKSSNNVLYLFQRMQISSTLCFPHPHTQTQRVTHALFYYFIPRFLKFPPRSQSATSISPPSVRHLQRHLALDGTNDWLCW